MDKTREENKDRTYGKTKLYILNGPILLPKGKINIPEINNAILEAGIEKGYAYVKLRDKNDFFANCIISEIEKKLAITIDVSFLQNCLRLYYKGYQCS